MLYVGFEVRGVAGAGDLGSQEKSSVFLWGSRHYRDLQNISRFLVTIILITTKNSKLSLGCAAGLDQSPCPGFFAYQP